MIPLLSHTTTHNTQHTTHKKKHCYHGPPKPPASSGSNFTGECDRCTLHDQYQSPQYGDVTFINKTNCSVILFTIILQAAAWRARGQKVSFYKLLVVLFLRNCIGTTALISAIWQYFICQFPTSTSH
jgi:hypothetical protein